MENDMENEQSEEFNEERSKIREKLSTMSFEDIQKLKEKIGSKLYNETINGAKSTNSSEKSFRRANKNRPREASSKMRPKFNISNTVNATKPVKKFVPRDPRFDPLCGAYDEKTFKSNYKFVYGIKMKEKKELEKEYEATVDPERKEQIKYLINRLKNQLREEEKREKTQNEIVNEKLEITKKLKHGEKPNYKKKSEKKVGALINKFEELKKSNKLMKHIEKRSKKLSRKGADIN